MWSPSSDAASPPYPLERRPREGRRDIAGPLFAPPAPLKNEGSRPLTGPFDLARGGDRARYLVKLQWPHEPPRRAAGGVWEEIGEACVGGKVGQYVWISEGG